LHGGSPLVRWWGEDRQRRPGRGTGTGKTGRQKSGERCLSARGFFPCPCPCPCPISSRLPLPAFFLCAFSSVFPCLLHVLLLRDQLDLEHEHGIGRDAFLLLIAVGEFRRDLEPADAARLHARDAFLPPLDELVQWEGGRLAAIEAAVELRHLVVGQPPGVVNGDGVAGLHRLTLSLFHVPDLETGLLLLPFLRVQRPALQLLLVLAGRERYERERGRQRVNTQRTHDRFLLKA